MIFFNSLKLYARSRKFSSLISFFTNYLICNLWFISSISDTKNYFRVFVTNLITINIFLLILIQIILTEKNLQSSGFISIVGEDLFLFYETNNLLFTLIPVVFYNNADTDKTSIFNDNKNKAGIYQWTHESGKKYVGSAINLNRRLYKYYSANYLNNETTYISRAIREHGHSKFSLSILEYIDISNLSKDEIKKLILSKEQYYIDLLNPEYNILKNAGSILGFRHKE